MKQEIGREAEHVEQAFKQAARRSQALWEGLPRVQEVLRRGTARARAEAVITLVQVRRAMRMDYGLD